MRLSLLVLLITFTLSSTLIYKELASNLATEMEWKLSVFFSVWTTFMVVWSYEKTETK